MKEALIVSHTVGCFFSPILESFRGRPIEENTPCRNFLGKNWATFQHQISKHSSKIGTANLHWHCFIYNFQSCNLILLAFVGIWNPVSLFVRSFFNTTSGELPEEYTFCTNCWSYSIESIFHFGKFPVFVISTWKLRYLYTFKEQACKLGIYIRWGCFKTTIPFSTSKNLIQKVFCYI